MENFDWKATISINLLKFKIIGLWPAGDETYRLNLYTLWTITSIILFIFGHNFFQAVNIFFIFDDLQAVTATLFVNLPELLGILKTYHLMRNMKILKRLMKSLSGKMFQPRNARQRTLVENSMRVWKSVYIFYWTLSGGAIFFTITFPILDNSTKEHRLPLMAWYPYNTNISPWYEITYIYQSIGFIVIATATLSVDCLITALNMYVGAQLDILCDDIRHLGEGGNGESFDRNLTNCIKHHRIILKFAKDSNMFFNWIVFLQFFISAVSIGVTMFQLTVVVPLSSEFLQLLSFGLAIIMQIFIYCWFANEVEDKVRTRIKERLLLFIQSKKIPYAAFESDWIEVSTKTKKNLLFFMMRCRKPIKMSALNVFFLTLDTFMKIMRTSWSYFALLSQVTSTK